MFSNVLFDGFFGFAAQVLHVRSNGDLWYSRAISR